MYNTIFTDTSQPGKKNESQISRQSSTDMLIRDYLRDHPLEEEFTLDKRMSSIHSVVSTQSNTEVRTIQDNASVYNVSQLASRTNNQSRERILTNQESRQLRENRNSSLGRLVSVPSLGFADKVERINLVSTLPH